MNPTPPLTPAGAAPETVPARAHHEPPQHWLFTYVFSQDHKTIARQFLLTGMFWALVGGVLSTLFRLQLGWPEGTMAWLQPLLGRWVEAGKLNPEFYLALVTMHGTIMLFFVLTAGLSGTFANLLIPLQIGARDMASGFMNMLSYWFFFLSGVIMFTSLFIETGPAASGWTVYPPLSALPQAIDGSGLGMTLWLVSMVLFVVSTLLGGVNYITTVLNLRTRGMAMTKLPLTVWALLITAILGLLTFPVLFAGLLLLVFDRSFGTSFFLSDIYIAGQALPNSGGSPVLFQHLFWFLGHPEVYIVIMPGMGIVSEILATNARKPIFGYRAMIGSLCAILFLSFVVWGHHMFRDGHEPLSRVGIHVYDPDYCRALGRENLQLAGYPLAGEYPLHHGHAVCHWLRVAVRGGRPHGHRAGQRGARYSAAQHLLRHCPLSPGDGVGGVLRYVCRRVPLVSEAVRADAGREAGLRAFLADFRVHLSHFHADALSGHCRLPAPLLRLDELRHVLAVLPT